MSGQRQQLVTLKSIATIVTGNTPKTSVTAYYDTRDIPFFKPSDIAEGAVSVLSDSESFLSSAAAGVCRVAPQNSILCTCIGIVGKIGILTRESSFNQQINAVVLDETIADPWYAAYAILSQAPKMQAKANAAVVPIINKSSFSSLCIPLPSIDTQRSIRDQLNSVQRRIDELKELASEFDLLVKSRFVEMFGDVESKEPDQLVELRTLLRMPASNGFFAKRKDYVEDGNVGILGVVNVVNRMYSGIDDLPRTNASSSEIDRYSLSYGDMLFCRSSLVLEGIGKASIVPPNVGENTLFECHVIRLPLDTNMCVPEFLQVQSTMPAFRKQMMAKAKTATMTTIDQKSILSAKVFLPPIELQKAYLAFIKQVDKSRFASRLATQHMYRWCEILTLF